MTTAAGNTSQNLKTPLDFQEEKIVKLKGLQEQLKDGAQSVSSKLLAKAAKIAKKFKLALFDDEDDDKGGKNLINQRQRLLDRIAALDKEFARKRLDSDAAEVQALKDKFGKIRQLVERFNADPKNKGAAISLAGFNALEGRSESELRQRQKDKATDKIRREAEATESVYDKAFQKQIDQLQDYQAKRTKIIEDHEKLRARLVANVKNREVVELVKQTQAELNALDDANAKKLGAYKKLFDGIEGLSDKQAQLVIDNAQSMLDTLVKLGKVSPELAKDIEKALSSATQSLSDRLPERLESLGGELVNVANSVKDIDEGFANVLGTLGNVILSSSDLKRNLDGFSAASAAGDTFGAATAGIGVFGAFLSGASAIANLIEGFYKNDIEQQKKIFEFTQNRLKGELEINELYRERAIIAAEIEGATLKNIASQRKALEEAIEGNKNDFDNVFGQFSITDIQNALDVLNNEFLQNFGDLEEKLLLQVGQGLFVESIDDNGVERYASLLGKTFEEIEALYADGVLTEQAATLFEQLRDLNTESEELKKQWDELNKLWKDILTGGATATAIADSIIKGFQDGKRAVHEFADDVEEILKNAVLSGFKYRFLEESLNALLDQLFNDAQSGEELDANEIAEFTQKYNEITADALKLLNQLQNDTGLDFSTGEGSGSSLLGKGIQKITEQTASELAGLARSTFDIQKRHLVVSEQSFEVDKKNQAATLDMMANTALIEQHTANTVVELKAINKNTKDSSGSYDNGTG